MTTVTCDKCRKVIKEGKDQFILSIASIEDAEEGCDDVDLCRSCERKLEEWLKGGKKK